MNSVAHFLHLLRGGSSLKTLAIRGALWTLGSYVISQFLRFGSNILLSRLLFPELFGLMTIVNILIVGLQLFSDIGVGTSIIQNKRGNEPVFLNTAWTLQVMRGIALWLGCLLIAFPAAQFYREPQLLWLIPVVGLTTIISGFNSTSLFSLNRDINLGKLTLFHLTIQIVSLAVTLTWAWLSPSLWALVGGSIVSALLEMVWSHRLMPGLTNRFAWEWEAAQSIFSFGKWIFISTALTFLAEQADRLILGRLIPFELLGVYGIAFTFADMPRQITMAVSSKVFFPTFAKMTDLPRSEFRAKILKNREPILVAIAFGIATMVCLGDRLILLVYDQRYAQAAWMLPILALGIWPRILTQTIDQVLFAIGAVRYPAMGCLFKFIFVLIGLPLGYTVMGLPGAVIVVALNDLPFYLAILIGLHREKLSVFVQDLKTTGIFLAILTGLLGVRYLLGFGTPIDTLLFRG